MSAPVARPSVDPARWRARERRRVRAHLRRAERAARRATVAHLDPLRRLVRALLLDELAAYQARGAFPRNLAEPGRHPVFVDDLGTRCAVAHLVEASGGAAQVADLAARRNLAYVDELAAEPGLLAWLDAAGISLAEAAAIQPGYSRVPSECVCGQEWFNPAPPYAVPATAVLDVRVTGQVSGFEQLGVIDAIDGTTSAYAVGQTVRVRATNVFTALPAGSVVLVPVGGPDDRSRFNVLDGGYGPPPIDGGMSNPQPPWTPTDAGPPLLGGYVIDRGSVLCGGAIGPLARADFHRAVTSPTCKAVLGALDPRWNVRTEDGGTPPISCAASPGTSAVPGTLALLLALLATRHRRAARRRASSAVAET